MKVSARGNILWKGLYLVGTLSLNDYQLTNRAIMQFMDLLDCHINVVVAHTFSTLQVKPPSILKKSITLLVGAICVRKRE